MGSMEWWAGARQWWRNCIRIWVLEGWRWGCEDYDRFQSVLIDCHPIRSRCWHAQLARRVHSPLHLWFCCHCHRHPLLLLLRDGRRYSDLYRFCLIWKSNEVKVAWQLIGKTGSVDWLEYGSDEGFLGIVETFLTSPSTMRISAWFLRS